MPWLQVKIDTVADQAEAVEGALGRLGAHAVSLEDAGDQPLLEPMPGDTPLWASVSVVGLFDGDADREGIRAQLAAMLDADAAVQPSFEYLPDREWQRAWMEDWHPQRFGRRLWIVPVGQAAPDPGAVSVHLDPGLAFGTGTHPTTALCLDWLDGQELAGERILDFGCGSGILAIAALRLGARAAVATDIDPQALEAARRNADANGVADRLVAVDVHHLEDAMFPVIVANILAGPLIESAADLMRRQQPGDRLVLAGVLEDQAGEVAAAYESGYDMATGAVRDGWVRLEGRRRA